MFQRLRVKLSRKYRVYPVPGDDRFIDLDPSQFMDRYATVQSFKPMESDEMEPDRMLKWFEFGHLPEKLQAVSKPFGELAQQICREITLGPERTVALRKLLEAKDAAVRAALNPGG